MYGEIIVPVDDIEGARVLPIAGQIARAAGASLTVLSVVHTDEQATERDRLIVAHIERAAHLDGIDNPWHVETVVAHHSDAADVIVERAQRADRLVCMSGGQHHTLAEPVRGTLAERVINRCPHPLVVVGRHCSPERGSVFRRLVVGLDGSREGDHALDVAALWAQAFSLDMVLVEAVDTDFVDQALAAGLDAARADVAESSYVASRATRLRRNGINATWDVLHDRHRRLDHHHHPADTLSRYADDLGDSLLVIATKGRAGLRLLAAGSTTHRLITHASVPVLVTHRGHDDELAADEFLDLTAEPATTQ